jgi:hypothetical protein
MLSNQWHVSARIFIKAKNDIWLYVLAHPEGCTQKQIASSTGYSYQMVAACTEELFLEDRISLQDGCFYPESDY